MSKPRCYETHPPLELLGGVVIHGGSCLMPAVKDADVYLGFDSGMWLRVEYPWNPPETGGPTEVLFRITDQSVPSSSTEFRKMVEWTADRLAEGKKVHAGCIGGHGRTGLFFAALVAFLKVSDDPIAYVRKMYCAKAVESQKQIDWLVEHYGAKPAKPSKPAWSKGTGLGWTSGSGGGKSDYPDWLKPKSYGKGLSRPGSDGQIKVIVSPAPGGEIWSKKHFRG